RCPGVPGALCGAGGLVNSRRHTSALKTSDRTAANRRAGGCSCGRLGPWSRRRTPQASPPRPDVSGRNGCRYSTPPERVRGTTPRSPNWRSSTCPRPSGNASGGRRGLRSPTNSRSVFASRSEEHTSELQSRFDLVCRLLRRQPPPFPTRRSSDLIATATGRQWAEWVQILDAAGARERNHTAIAELALEHMPASVGQREWWAQGTAVAYEQQVGLRV